MADRKGNNGLCPVKDGGPELFAENKLVVDIFRQAEGSAARIESKRKTYVYLRPMDIQSLFEMHGVVKDSRLDLTEKLYIMQDISNDLRPQNKAPKKIR